MRGREEKRRACPPLEGAFRFNKIRLGEDMGLKKIRNQ